MSDEQTPECTPNAHHGLREQYSHLAVGHHPDCACVLCGLRKMAGFVYQQPPREYRGRWPGSDEPPAIDGNDTLRIFDHGDPVWRRLADHLIFFKAIEEDEIFFEQLWARRVADNQFQICCIPGYIYGIALGDVVATDDSLVIQQVIERSGHSTFRIYSDEGWYGKTDALNHIAARDGLMELLSYGLTAISLEGDGAWTLCDYLEEAETAGLFVWEQAYWGASPQRPE